MVKQVFNLQISPLFLQNAVYKGEYTATHPTVRLFWEVFHEFPLEKKKQFLCKPLIASLNDLRGSLILLAAVALQCNNLQVMRADREDSRAASCCFNESENFSVLMKIITHFRSFE